MPKLSFISDKALEDAVKHLLQTADQGTEKAKQDFGRNVIDPFAVIFEMAGFSLDASSWEKNEKIRQAQKTLQNQIGEFHQKILGSIVGCKDLGTGVIVDLECPAKKIIAEIKNKYNTIKASDQCNLYKDLENQVMLKGQKYQGYTAYYVEIIPKNPEPYDLEFTPSDKSKGIKCPMNKRIRRIDGKSFYGKVTGVPDALEMLFDVLPDVIEAQSSYKFSERDAIKYYFAKAYKDSLPI
jgi:Eco47II restriction endonuclease